MKNAIIILEYKVGDKWVATNLFKETPSIFLSQHITSIDSGVTDEVSDFTKKKYMDWFGPEKHNSKLTILRFKEFRNIILDLIENSISIPVFIGLVLEYMRKLDNSNIETRIISWE